MSGRLIQVAIRPTEPQSKDEDMPFTTWQLHKNYTSCTTEYEANIGGTSYSKGGSFEGKT